MTLHNYFNWCPYKKCKWEIAVSYIHREKNLWGNIKNAFIFKPRETSEETNPTNTLKLDFQPPDLWKNKFLLLKPPSLWYLVMAALANQYTEAY